MRIIKTAKITVRSVIDNLEGGLPEGDPEVNAITSEGSYTVHDGGYIIRYAEVSEEARTDCELRIQREGVSLTRRGAVVCDILFEEGEEYVTLYSVPPYRFDMTVRTRRIRNSLTPEGGELQLIYSMNVGGQDKDVRMRIGVKVEAVDGD